MLELPPDQRDYLQAAGGPAAQSLLATLDRGLEATTTSRDEAVDERLRGAGLL